MMGTKAITCLLGLGGIWMVSAGPMVVAQAQGVSLLPSVSSTGERPPERLVLEDFPGALVDKVVVPVPGEIFAVMDKLGAPNWSGELRSVESALSKDRVVLSLAFGATVAEGFLAVQAEEPEAVEKLGRRLLRLASALAIEDRVLPHYQSIKEATDLADWPKVRSEIDSAQQTVRQAMIELRDSELATLVSLGGWLRGTEALTLLIAEAYNSDRAELLHQQDLVVHFAETVSEMSESVRSHGDVAAIGKGLTGIHQAMTASDETATGAGPGTNEEQADPAVASDAVAATDPSNGGGSGGGVIGVDQVKRISVICGELLQRFYSDPETAAATGSEGDSGSNGKGSAP